MIREFKQLLLNISSLGLSDQKWLINHLTPEQKKRFEELKGSHLLKKAQLFRKLPCPDPQKIIKKLPKICIELSKKNPLFIAIILEQGKFCWQKNFLNTYDQNKEIQQLLERTVASIKPATKAVVLQQWQNQLNFNDHLECIDG